MQPKIMSGVVVFALATLAGGYFAIHSWGGVIYISNRYLDGHRNPAAIHKVYDFSQLDGNALKMRSQRRLVEDAKIIPQQDSVGIELGHFVTRSADNKKVFACDYYDHVLMTFQAEGIAQNGEKPEMTIEGPCSVSADINRMAPIFIPVARILQQKPSNLQLQSTEQAGVNLHFNNVVDQWPKTWSLNQIQLSRSNDQEQGIVVDANELRQILEHPLTVQW